MSLRSLALVSTAFMALGVHVLHAEDALPLRSTLNDINAKPVADFPYGAAQAQQQAQVQAVDTSVVWEGRLRLGFGTLYDSTSSIGSSAASNVYGPTGTLIGTTGGSGGQSHITEFNAGGHIGVVGKTQSPWGEVGVSVAVATAVGTNPNGPNGFLDGQSFNVVSDGSFAYMKFSPNFTLTGGQVAGVSTAYSWDSNATNYFYGGTGGGVLGFRSSSYDPIGLRVSYYDGPLGLDAQINNSATIDSVSAFGGAVKASFKMDGFGADVGAAYNGNPTAQGSWGLFTGAGYKSGVFGVGAAAGMGGAGSTAITTVPASLFGYVNIFDQARFEMGATREFVAAGNNTVFGAGMYYTPFKQFTIGLEGNYNMNSLGAAFGDGSYGVGVVSQFSF